MPYVKKNKLVFTLVVIATFVAASVQSIVPLQIGKIINGPIKSGDKYALLIGLFVLLAFVALDLSANMGQRFATIRFAQNIIYDIRQDLFKTLQFQELEFYSTESVGQLMARSIQEVFSLRELLTWVFRISILITLLFIGAIIAVFQISPWLVIIYLILPIVMVGYTIRTSSNNRQIFYDARYTYGELSEVLAENLSGIMTVKSFGREKEQIEKFSKYNIKYFNASMKTAEVRANLIPGMVFMISTTLIFLIFVGGGLVAQGVINTGDFIAFMLLSLNIAIPGRFIGWVGIILQDGVSAAVRLNEIFKEPVSLTNAPEARDIEDIEGKITFENVYFGYPGKNHTLKNISFTINPGEKVAILGKTGSGKSTLINLIPRLFDPTKGRILIDDMDIKKEFTLRSLRSKIGVVDQEAFLFTLSLHDNIAFGCPDATREDVIAAAKIAQIHEFIETLEDGYDTIVGERGVTLSGGQKQRVAIARTILKKSKILIFDDSVSAVDPETELKIQSSLQKISGNQTLIVISQRPSSLQYVNRIIVLDNGEIVQDGTHEELSQVPGIYSDFITAVKNQVKFMNWDEIEVEL